MMGSNRKRKFPPHITSARDIWRNFYKEIDFETFYKLSQLPCSYCGSEPRGLYNKFVWHADASEFSVTNGTFKYNGLDRIDSSKPHTLNNIVTCCKICNWGKRQLSQKDFLDWAERVYQNRCC